MAIPSEELNLYLSILYRKIDNIKSQYEKFKRLISILITYIYQTRCFSIFPVIAIFSVWLGPFEAAFFPTVSKSVVNISGYIVDFVFFCEIMTRLVKIVRNPPVICIRLVFKNWYWMLDIIAITFAIIHVIICTLRTSAYAYVALACSLMRLLRIVRFRWVHRLFDWSEINLMLIKYSFIRCARVTLTILVAVHYQGCMFYFIASRKHTKNTWIDTIHGNHVFVSYVTSIYWAMTTVTSTGYGDLHPVNTIEKIYAVFAMLSNVALLLYVSENLVKTCIINTNGQPQSYRQTRQSLLHYAKKKNIPNEVQKSMLDSIKDDFENNRFPKDIIKRFPKSFNSKVNEHLFRTILEEVYLFKDTSPAFLIQLTGIMEIESYLYGDLVIGQNDEPSAFYILISGQVKLERTNDGEDGNQMIQLRDVGSVIGELGVIGGIAQPYSVSTLEFTKLLKVNGAKYDAILRDNLWKEKVGQNYSQVHSQYWPTQNNPVYGEILERFLRL